MESTDDMVVRTKDLDTDLRWSPRQVNDQLLIEVKALAY